MTTISRPTTKRRNVLPSRFLFFRSLTITAIEARLLTHCIRDAYARRMRLLQMIMPFFSALDHTPMYSTYIKRENFWRQSLFSGPFFQDQFWKYWIIFRTGPENKLPLLAEFIFRTGSDWLSRHCLLSKKVCCKVIKLDNLTLQMCLWFIYLQFDVWYVSCNSNLVDKMSKLKYVVVLSYFWCQKFSR